MEAFAAYSAAVALALGLTKLVAGFILCRMANHSGVWMQLEDHADIVRVPK